jgi:hypothetical protein
MSAMRLSRLRVEHTTAIGLLSLVVFSAGSIAQTVTVPASSPAQVSGLQCNGSKIFDPFKGSLAGTNLPPGLLPIDATVKDKILKSGLPCQENVRPGAQDDPAGIEATGLESLQRGFDFYSWRTFIALNSPADGKTPIDKAEADTPTRWEDMDNFKQLLDVMLPADQQPPIWPRDRAGMDAERERLMPEACKRLQQNDPTLRDRKIVKMIEESYNEPFKTGPLIDQDGHYAIFDILMNREMFDYITEHHLNTKAGQAANADLAVDFPAGQNDVPAQAGEPAKPHKFGAFMLKVSWKILSDAEKAAKTFHMIDALVLMPPNADRPETARRCLPRTLGLVGFHAVHKTVGRPQWIWTTFEHVKNVPDKDEVAANKLADHYNFFDAHCKSGCPTVNATPSRPWEPSPALELSFRVDNSYKSQIVRETPLTDAAKHMNAIFHSLLPPDNVWQNYMLISTQWPSAFAIHCTGLHSQSPLDPKTDFVKQPDMTCSPAPIYLANSTLETYSQADNKVEKQTDENGVLPDDLAVPLATSSCIACHSNAVGFQRTASNREAGRPNLNQSDFTFMLEKAQ